MKLQHLLFLLVFATSCNVKKIESPRPIQGTWKLLSGTLIEKGDTTITIYSDSLEMIKVINQTHFAFLNHDTRKGKDAKAVFVAGGGEYDLVDDQYTEHLEYCSDRQWEGHDFKFTVAIENDTLVQTGREEIKDIGLDRLNIEKYIRVR
jgi:hypothetical protein